MQKQISLGLFRSGTRRRGRKFLRRHPKGRREGMVSPTVPVKWGAGRKKGHGSLQLCENPGVREDLNDEQGF